MTEKAMAKNSGERLPKVAPRGRLVSRLSAQPGAKSGLPSSFFQAKLSVSKASDPLEVEAERVADTVSAGRTAPAISRLSGTAPRAPETGRAPRPEDEDKDKVQRARKDDEKDKDKVQRARKDEDKDKIQRARKDEDKDKIQRARKVEDKDKVQRARKDDEKDKVQREGGGDGDSHSELAIRALAAKGSGAPLTSGIRSRLESSFGTDFGAVRVHEDENARSAASGLNARAFTHGSDIFLGRGESQSDLRLMAHEATHVVQQGAGVQRLPTAPEPTVTAPAAPDAAPAVDPMTLPLETGRLNPATDTITFSGVLIPPFKMEGHRGTQYNAHKPLKHRKNYDRGNPDQRTKWKNGVAPEQIKTNLEEKTKQQYHLDAVDPSATHVFEIPVQGEGAHPYLFGNLDAVAKEMTTPMWGRDAESPALNFFDVDHIVELQLADWGGEGNQWANELPNMELLDSEINQESGRVIRDNIIAKVNDFLRVTGTRYGTSAADIKARYHLEFQTPVAGGAGATTVALNDFWRRDDIEQGRHLGAVHSSGPEVLGGDGRVRVFSSATGGLGKSFPLRGMLNAETKNWLKPFEIKERTFNTDTVEGPLGSFTINIPPDHPDWEPLEGGDEVIEITRITGATHAGYVQKQSVLQSFTRIKKKGASPIRVDTFELMPDVGIVLEGAVLPELPLLRGGLGFRVSNGQLRLYKAFNSGELEVPSPFSIRGASLVVFADTASGFGGEGRVNFGIDKVGEGFVSVEASTGGPLAFRGGFDFDSRVFEPARVELAYIDGKFSGRGQLGIPEGKVPGVKSATVDIRVEGDSISGTGTIEPAIDAIQSGTVSFSYSPEDGITLGGNLTLSDRIPNVNSGSIRAELKKPPQAESYSLNAHGELQASLAGFAATVTADYRDGLFTVEGDGTYHRGLMSGSIRIGATNRNLDEAGNLGDQAADHVTAFGRGSVTIRLAPWLQGTAAIRLLPNGELELAGEIALPSQLELFSLPPIDKSILDISAPIPLFPGIILDIGGSLGARASIGPGVLDQLRIGVTYNPAHEDQTHVTGDAHLNIPTQAGLRLAVHAGIGLGIPGASATGGLEIGGMLGISGAAEASVRVDWTPATGLHIDALGRIHAEPKFRFDISGFVSVRALGFSVYSKRWELAAFEYGSNLGLGIEFPIHYVQGEPFDISLSDVKFITPDIDPLQILEGLVHRITD